MPDLGAANPLEDPANAAFLRASGYSESVERANAQQRIDALNRQLANGLPDYQAREDQGIQDIAASAESNGVLRSGQRLVDQQKFSDSVGRDRNAFETGIQDQQDQVYADLIRQIAQLQQQRAENDLTSRANIIATGF